MYYIIITIVMNNFSKYGVHLFKKVFTFNGYQFYYNNNYYIFNTIPIKKV